MPRVVHVFDQDPEDAKDLEDVAIMPSVEVSAATAANIEAVADTYGQTVHYNPEQGGENYTYTPINGDPE